MTHMNVFLLSLLMLTSVSSTARSDHDAGPPDTTTVIVHVRGAESTDGRAIVALFADEEGFPREIRTAAYTAAAPLRTDSASVEISEVPAGDYAVFAVHDADGDGRLNTNWVGMPTEGIALSNWSGGRPGFEESTIEVGPEPTSITLTFYYR